MQTIVGLVGRRVEFISIPDALIDSEQELHDFIKDFRNYIEDYKIEYNDMCLPHMCENNKDHIISYLDQKYIFSFNNNRICNWWLQDDAPKVILLHKDISQKKVIARTKINIMPSFTEKEFQVGIFIRNNNAELSEYNSYLGAIDNSGQLVLGELGKDSIAIPWEFTEVSELVMVIEKNEIMFGIINEGNIEKKLRCTYNNTEISEIGIVCKTWGNGGKLTVIFEDFNVGVQ